MRARAKADEAEAKAAAKLERQAAIQAKREARDAVRAARKQPTTEPDVDDSDGSERPIAVAAKLQQDHEDAEQREREAREAKERAAQVKREAAAARKAAKAELAAARQKEREEAAAAKAAAKAEREDAKAAKVAATATRDADDDHIVEAPREPKKSLLERILPEQADRTGDDEDAPSSFVPTLAVVLGALGFVFSVILAIGAFMVALNPQDDGGLFSLVSNICDALVGPLRGLFSFSGVNGESKEALVAWGLGALGYLVLGLFAQSLLRSRAEDD